MALKVPRRPELMKWSCGTIGIGRRQACRIVGLERSTCRYQAHPRNNPAFTTRLKELAAVRVRFGYRRLTTLLRREGWEVNAKRVYRIYRGEGLAVRTRGRKKRAAGARVPLGEAVREIERWSMDSLADRLVDGRMFQGLTAVDRYSRECPLPDVGRTLTGKEVVESPEGLAWLRGMPESITVDNGSEFCSRAVDAWAYQHRIRLGFIRPGRPVENGYIESFNGKLRDECLNAEVFYDLADARQKLEAWRRDYNEQRPHSAPGEKAPLTYLQEQSGGNDGKA